MCAQVVITEQQNDMFCHGQKSLINANAMETQYSFFFICEPFFPYIHMHVISGDGILPSAQNRMHTG